MKLGRICLEAALIVVLGVAGATAARAGISESEQAGLRAQYVDKVLIFHDCYRLINRLEVMEDGTVRGKVQPGYWATDGAFQVKSVKFGKDRVSFKGPKLWADIRRDGTLHYFPAALALKVREGYAVDLEVVFHTSVADESAARFAERVKRVFFGDQESKLESPPAAIARFIRNETVKADIDPAAGLEFKGTPPKPLSTPTPSRNLEANLAGQSGTAGVIILVDEQGNASVDGFTKLLQYGLEEATIEAVKKWKFEPATQDGKAVPVRLALDVKFAPSPR